MRSGDADLSVKRRNEGNKKLEGNWVTQMSRYWGCGDQHQSKCEWKYLKLGTPFAPLLGKKLKVKRLENARQGTIKGTIDD